MNNFTNLKGKINRRTKNRRLTKLTSKANGLTINRKQIIIMIPSNTEYKRNDFKLDKVPKKNVPCRPSKFYRKSRQKIERNNFEYSQEHASLIAH